MKDKPMVDYTPASDLLGHTAPLDHAATFPLLGLPLEIRSNSPTVIAAAERSFGHWKKLDPALIEKEAPLVVTIVMHPSSEDNRQYPVAPWVQRAHSSCFIASSGANMITASMDHGRALGFVTPELVADDASFRYQVLECLSLLLAGWRDRTPVHAGALVRNGCALLLVGASTAGKSTLCYAGVRAGFQLMAEDVVYVSTRNGTRMWGNPWYIHLLPDAQQLFSELAEQTPERRPNGKHKLVIDVAASGEDRLCRSATRAVVCFLQRDLGSHDSVLTPIDKMYAQNMLSRSQEVGFDLFHNRANVTDALTEQGAYCLTVGRDLDHALSLLNELADHTRHKQR